MIQASCEGMIDYSKANVLDPRWWKKLTCVLDYAERQSRIRLNEYRLDFNLAAIDYNTGTDTFELHWDQATAARNCLIDDVMPWLEVGNKTVAASAEELREQWIDEWGDPSSAETQANIQALREHWAEVRKRGKQR